MNLKTLFFILALAFATATTSAQVTPEGPPMTPEFNRESTPLTVRVFVHETHEEVTAAKRKLRPQDRPEALLGWAVWGPTESGTCDLHVARADSYMDAEFAVWGHELAHCLYGNFHKELDGH